MTHEEQERCHWADLDRQIAVIAADVAHLRDVLNIHISGTKDTLDRQAVEYERRLSGLNNENQRIQAIQKQSVSAELWRAEHRALEGKIEWVRNMVYAAGGGLMVVEFLLRYLGK
jgi:hypothetical protein